MKRILLAALLLMSGATIASADDADVDCSTASDTPSVTQCAAEDLDKADAELNAVYKLAMAYQADIDKTIAESGLTGGDAVKSLKAAERAWITYRDAHCEAVTAANIGGTGYPAFVVSCQAEMTRRRTLELKALMEGNN